MTKFRKAASLICSLVIAVTASVQTAPFVFAEEDEDIVAYENDFETLQSEKTTTFEAGMTPYATRIEDGQNHYADVDAGHYYHPQSGILTDWVNGGYPFTKQINSGIWTVDFDFKYISGFDGYSAISLANMASVKDNLGSQFKILSQSGNNLLVNGLQLTGSATKNNWYHYYMKFNKTAKTYEVKITDGTTTVATGSGSFTQTWTFDGLLFQQAVRTYIDNIKIAAYQGAPVVTDIQFLDATGEEQQDLDPSTEKMVVIFSEKMDADTLDDVTLTGVENVSTRLINNNKELEYTFDDLLIPNQELELTIPTTVKSKKGIGFEKEYVNDLTVADPNILLDIDFDNNNPAVVKWDGNPTVSYPTEGGNKYLMIDTLYQGSGFYLKNDIPKDGGDYTLTFDFMLPNLTDTDTKYMCINQAFETGNSSEDASYNQFGLLRTRNAKFAFNNADCDGMEAEGDIWYTYKLDFNRKTRQYSLKITQRDDPDYGEATSSGSLLDENYSNGMLENRIYNSIKFHYVNTICVDNLYLIKKSVTPRLASNNILFYDGDGQEVDCSVNNVSMKTHSIALDFGEIMNSRGLKNRIKLKQGNQNMNFDFSIQGSKVMLSNLDLQQETEYTVIVDGNAMSVNGDKLLEDEDVVLNFTTAKSVYEMSLTKVMQGESEVRKLKNLYTGAIRVIVHKNNTKITDEKSVVMVCFYDANGKMIGIEAKQVIANAKTEADEEVTINVTKPETAVSARVMLWDSPANNGPISSSICLQ